MKPIHKYALIGIVVLAAIYYVYRRKRRGDATQAPAPTLAAQTWPPMRTLAGVPPAVSTAPPAASAAPTVASATAAASAASAASAAAAASVTSRPGIVGVGAESPSYIAPIGKTAAAKPGICESAFDEVASTLISANRVVDERIAPVISSKNGGLLPNLDVRGDYAAMMCVDEERADDCGIWNRSSAQRGIKLGYIKDTDRRRVVLAGP